MKWIFCTEPRGEPITRYCSRVGLPLRRRLELFRQVCLAVRHAHQRLIIHRDIKPGNVLVTEAGEPKLLAFGIARVLDESPGSTAANTRTGQIVGTPGYMSPEQAEGNPELQDVRSDVYALGVIGYEMLAGRLPYELKDKPLLEQLTVVRDQEPVRLGKVNPSCRGDVETVVAKALEKDPARRYQSAGDLADDLERYLNDRPVSARPPSAWYVLRKFARRNPVVVGGAVSAALLLAAGLVASLALMQTEAERAAKQRLFAESKVQQARRLAQLGELSAAVATYEEALAAGHPDQARLRVDRAKVLIDLGRAGEAVGELEAVAAREDLAGERASALLYLGDMRAAFDAKGGLERVKRATQIGLAEPGERAFAAGLLARTSEEAIAGFVEALRTDPANRRANEMLFWTLVLLGRRDEARARLAVLRAYYPSDGRLNLGRPCSRRTTKTRPGWSNT